MVKGKKNSQTVILIKGNSRTVDLMVLESTNGQMALLHMRVHSRTVSDMVRANGHSTKPNTSEIMYKV